MLDLLLPRRCACCGRAGADVCEACLAALPRLGPPLCSRCGAPTAWPVRRCVECAGRRLAFASARAAVTYDERVRALVAAWKERNLRGLAVPAAGLVAAELARPPVAALVPAPPDRERGRSRGHHPAGELARCLAERWELPLVPALRRTREAPRQRGLTLVERRRNLRGAVEATTRVPPRVALVDDVYTTGATASAAATALRKAGARVVHVVTLARAIRSDAVWLRSGHPAPRPKESPCDFR